MTSLSSSTRASFAPSFESFESSTSGDTFFVFCVYDFEAADADQLSFRSSEILEVVKKEESGWWAAIREGEEKVGWIPSAYVEPISITAVEELLAFREQQQCSVKPSTGDADCHPGFKTSFGDTYPSPYEWITILKEDGKVSPLPPTPSDTDLPKDVSSAVFSPVSSLGVADPSSPGQEIVISPSKALGHKGYPPSPSMPMPTPPPKSAPIAPSEGKRYSVRRSLSCPQPPLPNKAGSPLDPGSSPQSRVARRRPVLIEDSISLRRLSVLLEAHGVEEVERRMHSPDMPEPVDGTQRAHSLRSAKVRQITGEDEAQAIYEAYSTQVSQPPFLRPVHGDDEIHIDPSGAIVSGTLSAIVERLTLEPLNPTVGERMRHTFLRTFRTFASANEIFDLLLERYDLDVPQAVTATELEEWRTRRLLQSQRKVLAIFMSWLVDHNMIEEDPSVARRLQDFLSEISEPPDNVAAAQEVRQALERITFAVPLAPIQSAKPHKRRRTKDSKNELSRTDPTVLAEQLSLYEHKYYAKIRPQECLDWTRSRENDKVGNLYAFCTLHDKLAAWVKHSVLWTETLGRRADMVDFWIKVAEKCRSMHNYSSMSAIVTALSSTVLSKLHLTWAHVGRTSHLDPLAKFNDPSGSFSAFRQAQQTLEHDVPCVPFVGMYLTDFVHINDQFKDKDIPTTDPEKPTERHFCFLKRRKWTEVLDTMLQYQKIPYPFAQDPATVQLIETNLAAAAEKDQAEFWSKSQEVLQVEVASADIRKGLQAAGF
ncbi:hypothetical protein NM688_g2000 [Phlebia brevispora]|uniref:Uncharacterized protein n=1 Tax=Phlebia brevispora TaxID=194682 RepID=A0ACC1T9W9_9APHY|nr:hypothetical protein NM688_g2000 [Phlebia brevispora]